MSKTIPDLYAAVCAKRPDLAVEHIAIRPESCVIDAGIKVPSAWRLMHGWDGDGEWRFETNQIGRSWHSLAYPEEHAAALILARWVEMLPVGNGLYHAENYENGETRWWIGPNASMPTPIEALAAFWLQQ